MASAPRVRAGAHGGGEGGAVGAVVDQAALQLQGEMPFGAADQDGLQEFTEGLVGDLGADAQAGDLLLVLDHPELLDRLAQVGQAQPGCDGPHGAVPDDGEVVVLGGEGLGALGRGEAGRRDGGVASGSRQRPHPERFVGPGLGRPVVQRSGADQHVLGLAEEQHGAVRGGAREIAHVGGPGDERRRAAARVAAFP